MPRRLIISPVLLHGDRMQEGCHFVTRDNLMCRLHAMLEFDPIPGPRGEIKVMALEDKFETNKAYWGGDGIALLIPESATSKDVYEGLNRFCRETPKFVVHEPETGETHGVPKPLVPPAPLTAEIIQFPKR